MKLNAIYENGRIYFDRPVRLKKKKIPVLVVVDEESTTRSKKNAFNHQSNASPITQLRKRVTYLWMPRKCPWLDAFLGRTP